MGVLTKADIAFEAVFRIVAFRFEFAAAALFGNMEGGLSVLAECIRQQADAEQEDQKPYKELCKRIASLYTIPAAVYDYSDEAKHAQDHTYPAKDRCCPEWRLMIDSLFSDILREKNP